MTERQTRTSVSTTVALATVLLTTSALLSPLHAEPVAVTTHVVGALQIELPGGGKFRLVSMPFEAGENTLMDVFGTDTLRKSIFLSACDKVILHDPAAQVYQRWAQRNADGHFYKANDGTEWGEQIVGNPVIEPGTGFWISSAAAADAFPIILAGDVISEPNHSKDMLPGFQIVAFPFSSDFDLADSAGLIASGASGSMFLSGADRISVYRPETQSYQRYALHSDGDWYRANDGTEWAAKIPSNEVIDTGSSFWYEAIKLFTWTENNPYLADIQ